MTAYLSELESCGTEFGPAPVLIAADCEAAMKRAARTMKASGIRVADKVGIGDAPERIELQAAASAVWIELEMDGGAAMDRLLTHVSRGADAGRYSAIVSGRAGQIDVLAARLGDSGVELIVDADDAERAAALALALAVKGGPMLLSDIASDRSAARLRQLSDEVGRIAATLARLSAGPAASRPVAEPAGSGVAPEVSADSVRSVIRARRLRARFFPEELFADPAWDMLLDLLQAEIAQLRVPVSSLCIAAAVPATTALRWLKTMAQQGVFVRRADPHDGRRVFVELAPDSSRAMRLYFAEVGNLPVI
ncbi:MAG TPA: MarR family transcriptional regulator [Sphingomicrobium sp.]|nr:MarR family transcriptional regulator [Sphingomicrobium sp.]